ncbi:Nn.00g116030.m01.CDS01 [Neocucurbitaria sp. VM-36]
MAWFMRGVQSAVFHYASCAPCTGYTDGRKRRKAAKQARKVREKLQLEDPDSYHHPGPTGTNPYWDEEIAMGPGPPPRRARRTNTGSTRGITTAGTQSSAVSKGGSSLDVVRTGDMRLSDDTLDDDNWNRKRYQREDEDLWGHEEPPVPLNETVSGSSVGVAGFQLRRPGTSRSGSYYAARAPPVNHLHPPVVSLPSPDPADNRWMLQPPPKASVMAGKERASNRSRSGSGASSRVELSLQRQLSSKQVQQRLERGETPELPSISPMSSYSNLVSGQRHERGRTPQARPPSSSSSRRKRRTDAALTRTDTAMTRSETASTQHSSGDIDDTVNEDSPAPRTAPIPDLKGIRARHSRPHLSTIVSTGSEINDISSSSSHDRAASSDENALPEKPSPVHQRLTSKSSTDPTASSPYLLKRRGPLSSSDISSLNVLQDLVSPRALLSSRFVSAPLVEAKIRLPPSAEDLKRANSTWNGSRFGVSRGWDAEPVDEQIRVPFDNPGPPDRDPRLRWSVDF